MASKAPKKRTKSRSKPKRQEYIDAYNFVESRKTWNPDPVRMEREIEEANSRLARKYAKINARRKSA